jgi:hypothetical protein
MSKDAFDTSRHYPRLIESLLIKVSDLRSVPPAQGIGPSVACSAGGKFALKLSVMHRRTENEVGCLCTDRLVLRTRDF